jgi:phenylacetate-CoA ligase
MMERAGLDPTDIQCPDDLRRLPLTTKADIRENQERLRSRIATKLVPFSTGGSTGSPLLFYLSRERIGAAMGCRQRVMRWWGLSVGDREFAPWGSPVEVTRQDRLRSLRDKLPRTGFILHSK